MAHLFIVIQSVPYDEFIGDAESDPVCLIMFLPSFGQNLIKYNACSDGCGTAFLAEFHCFGVLPRFVILKLFLKLNIAQKTKKRISFYR